MDRGKSVSEHTLLDPSSSWTISHHQTDPELDLEQESHSPAGAEFVKDKPLPVDPDLPQGQAQFFATMVQQMKLQMEQQTQIFAALTLPPSAAPPPSPSTIKVPKLFKIKGSDRVDKELLRFEQHVTAYHVPRENWVVHLRPLLEGEALEAYISLNSSRRFRLIYRREERYFRPPWHH